MTYEEARAVFLLEHCGERCDGPREDTDCAGCEIAVAISALEAVMRIENAITELEEQRYYAAAEIIRKAVEND